MNKRPYDYLYITARNTIMARSDSETYTKENQGAIVSIPHSSLESAKSLAIDLAQKYGLESSDVVISLRNKELKR